jgi:hypothetical protein
LLPVSARLRAVACPVRVIAELRFDRGAAIFPPAGVIHFHV